MNIIHFLHECILARYAECVGVVFINGVSLLILALGNSKFPQRFFKLVFLEVVDHSSRRYAI